MRWCFTSSTFSITFVDISTEMNIDRRRLKLVAKKTLGLDQDDDKEISSIYLTHLKHFVTKYPDDTKFNINLDDGGKY